jgi:hypothetical protein
MRLIIEVDDVGGTFYANMQAKSDEAWREDPEDGAGSMGIGTPGAQANARILAVEVEENRFGWLSGNRWEEAARTLAQAAGVLAAEDGSSHAREVVQYLTGTVSKLLRQAQAMAGEVARPELEPGGESQPGT